MPCSYAATRGVATSLRTFRTPPPRYGRVRANGRRTPAGTVAGLP